MAVASIAFCVTAEEAGNYLILYTITNETTNEVVEKDTTTVSIYKGSSYSVSRALDSAAAKKFGFESDMRKYSRTDKAWHKLVVNNYEKK